MYTNTIKLPLIRVAHPSQEECEKILRDETDKIKMRNQIEESLDKEMKVLDKKFADEGVNFNEGLGSAQEHLANQQKYAVKPPSHKDYTPQIFAFDHHYDSQLTPRKGWQQQVTNLNSLLDHEKEKLNALKMESI